MESLNPESIKTIDQLNIKDQWNSQVKILTNLGICQVPHLLNHFFYEI